MKPTHLPEEVRVIEDIGMQVDRGAVDKELPNLLRDLQEHTMIHGNMSHAAVCIYGNEATERRTCLRFSLIVPSRAICSGM